MPINFDHKDDISAFVMDNIELINSNIREFSFKKHNTATNIVLIFDSTDIRRYLKDKFNQYILTPGNCEDLVSRFEAVDFVKNKIKDIAVDVGLYKGDLEKFYKQIVFDELSNIDRCTLEDTVINSILNLSGFGGSKARFVKAELKPILSKSLYLALKNGFTFNLNNTEDGVMSANAGDSAQFLFLARAILAGYNCSNVDVRSSRYDAVIDHGGRLFRVQVKGITQNNSLQFKDRDRGGRGIDTSNEHNQGRRITADDCDIYVAVDKQSGICYIIPISQIVEWNADSISISKAEFYKENWHIIDSLQY